VRTVRRLLYGDILSSVGFVALAFLSLFFFIDFVDELRRVGQRGYTTAHALLASVLEAPGNLYELAPIAVLIGTIHALSRLAQSSEYTILRTGGLGPGRALGLLARLGLVFVAITWLVGDFVAPVSERLASELQARHDGGFGLGRSGAWLKERRGGAEGEVANVSVNVGGAQPDGELRGIRIFEFDRDGRLVRRISAEAARVRDDGPWNLRLGDVTEWPIAGRADANVRVERFDERVWPSSLTTEVVTAAVMPLKTMSTLELRRYIGHLARNEQAAQPYQIAFWKRALYPLACLVMVGLALPFAYLQARAGGVSLKVFGGIMIGISFVLLNNVAGHLGQLRDWEPWVAAAMPSLLYLGASLAAFAWLVRYR
jgi:lipopolysaccharide export system permease protein